MILESRMSRRRRHKLHKVSLWEKIKSLFKKKNKVEETKEFTDEDFRREFIQ